MNGQINKFCSAGLNVFELFAGFCNNIYFFSGWYGCSNVAAADAVADEAAVVAGPAFVACYHCHLPRSLYKHGASLEAPYPPRNPKSPEKDLRASAAYSVARPPGGRPWFLFGVNYFLCFRLFTPGSK